MLMKYFTYVHLKESAGFFSGQKYLKDVVKMEKNHHTITRMYIWIRIIFLAGMALTLETLHSISAETRNEIWTL